MHNFQMYNFKFVLYKKPHCCWQQVKSTMQQQYLQIKPSGLAGFKQPCLSDGQHHVPAAGISIIVKEKGSKTRARSRVK